MKIGLIINDLQMKFLSDSGDLTVEQTAMCHNISNLAHLSERNGVPTAIIAMNYQRNGHSYIADFNDSSSPLRKEAGIILEPSETSRVPIFWKSSRSAATNPQFLKFLNNHHIDTVVITGGFMERCVLRISLDLAEKGIRSLIPKEAIFDLNRKTWLAGQTFTENLNALLTLDSAEFDRDQPRIKGKDYSKDRHHACKSWHYVDKREDPYWRFETTEGILYGYFKDKPKSYRERISSMIRCTSLNEISKMIMSQNKHPLQFPTATAG